MKFTTTLHLLFFSVFLPGILSAGWDSTQAFLMDRINAMRTECEHEIPVKIERKTFDNRSKDWGGAENCAAALDAIKDTCGYENKKFAFKIDKFFCRGSSRSSSEFVEFKNGQLVFEIGKESEVNREKAIGFLKTTFLGQESAKTKADEDTAKLATEKRATEAKAEADKKAKEKVANQKRAEEERLAAEKRRVEIEKERTALIEKSKKDVESNNERLKLTTQYQSDVNALMARKDLSPQDKATKVQELASQFQKAMEKVH